jgi:hypothetical protein
MDRKHYHGAKSTEENCLAVTSHVPVATQVSQYFGPFCYFFH